MLRVSEAAELLRVRPGDMCRYVQHEEPRHITAKTLLRLLNGRRAGQWDGEMWRLPERLLTPDEAARAILPRMTAAKARRRLLSMCLRQKNPPPHIRFTKRTVRFDAVALRKWVAERSEREAVFK
jgi:hypothetical protein